MLSEGEIHIRWGPRKEPVEACAERLARTLDDLSQLESAALSWSYGKTRTVWGSAESDLHSLVKLLEAGVDRKENLPEQIVAQLGYRVWLQTESAPREQLVLMVHTGSYRASGNNCAIDFPKAGPHAYGNMASDVKIEMMRALIRNWNPDSAGIYTLAWTVHLYENFKELLSNKIGWVTYVSHPISDIPAEMREKYRVEEVPSFGSLIYLADEPPPDETEPQYFESALELYRMLAKYGLTRTSQQ